jgi:hypothetical protein
LASFTVCPTFAKFVREITFVTLRLTMLCLCLKFVSQPFDD